MSHFLGVPVRDGDRVLGIIFAANKVSAAADRRGFTERDEEILSLFAAHAAIALTNARLYEQSRELSIMAERSRLARELHDAVTQKLFSIRAHARAAAVLAGREPFEVGRVQAEIEAVGALGAEAHAELRAVIDGLAPPDLRDGGLAPSLRRYAVLAGRGVRRSRSRSPRPAARARPPPGGRAVPGRPGGAAQRAAALRGGPRSASAWPGPPAGSPSRSPTTGTGSARRRRPAGSGWPRCGSGRRRRAAR